MKAFRVEHLERFGPKFENKGKPRCQVNACCPEGADLFVVLLK